MFLPTIHFRNFVPISAFAIGAALGISCAETPQPEAFDPPFLKFTESVRGIYEDSKGRLWITSPEGRAMIDPTARNSADGGITYFENDIAGILCGGFQEDSQGRIWTQTAEGIHRIEDGKLIRAENRIYSSSDQWSKEDGDLWFGVDNALELGEQEKRWGVYRLHNDEFTFLAFPPFEPAYREHFLTLTAHPMQAADGTLWFGTFEAAIGFDGNSFDIIDRKRMGRADDPRHIGIRGYRLDSRGLLWMADNGVGVYVYDGTEVVHFTALHKLRPEDTDGTPMHRSFSIGQSQDGAIWIGCAYSGVFRYQPSESDPIGKGTFTHFGPEHGLPCKNIWKIYQTRSGEVLFAGEEPAGVYRFNGESFERLY